MLYLKPGVEIVKGASQAALYDLEGEQVYELNRSGTMIVDLLSKGQSVSEIIVNISQKENVGNKQIALFVEEFIGQLLDLGLLIKGTLSYKFPSNEFPETDTGSVRPLFLKEVWCEITSNCNNRCLHCYAKDSVKATDISTDSWIKIIRQIGKIGCEHLQFTGGEPFLRKDIWKLVSTALRNNLEVEIYSNLTLCEENDIIKCKRHRVAIATTVLGPNASIHDSITQVPGSFSQTIKAIKRLVELGCKVRVSMIIMKQNQDYLEETLDFIRDLGVNQYRTDYMRPVGKGAANRHFAAQEWNTKPILTTNILSFHHNHLFSPCWGHKLAIKSDGTVLPCVLARNIVLGNVIDESIHTIINSDEVRKLWGITLDQIETCQDCEFRYACQDCRVLALCQQGGGLYRRIPGCLYDPYTGIWQTPNV